MPIPLPRFKNSVTIPKLKKPLPSLSDISSTDG